MFKFYHKIRQQLLADNKISKYLLYAVGEILLVVIGILIALQIDNWNEERKFRAQQYSLLKDLTADLQANLRELENGRETNKSFLNEYQGLAQAIREDLPASPTIDSLCRHLANWHSPFFTRTAYESLKNKGLEIIDNDTLKKQIVALFEKEFVYLSEDYDRTEWEFASSIKTPLLNNYLQYEQRNNRSGNNLVQFKILPVDFESMKADRQFINMLSELIVYRSRGVYQYTRTIDLINAALQSIEDQLETLGP
jgi:hypothetical protein